MSYGYVDLYTFNVFCLIMSNHVWEIYFSVTEKNLEILFINQVEEKLEKNPCLGSENK